VPARPPVTSLRPARSDGPGRGLPRTLWLVPGAMLAAAIGLLTIGSDAPLSLLVPTWLSVLVFGGWTPAVYLLAAVGWGSLARRGQPLTGVHAALGLAATLTITHLLGVLGLLNPITAWAWIGAGLALLVRFAMADALFWPGRLRELAADRPRLAVWCLGALGVAIMLVAAASPPGSLWDSEFGGYDSLSYHTQLPAEWLDAGRVMPVEHNVYSFLPGYVEAATVHLAHLAGVPARTPDGLSGLLAGQGDLVTAPHFLALGLTLLAAWATGTLTRTAAERSGVDERAARLAGSVGGALVVLTPWSQVVGSMAYNESGVVALGAAAMAVAFDAALRPGTRAVLAAVLLGAACGCKPTAILFLAPAVAIALGVNIPVKSWARPVVLGAVTGLLMLAPWLVRNTMSGGNPVFPQAVGLFGEAHWSAAQAARYAAGHHNDTGLIDSVLMLVRPDPAADHGAPSVVRWRGLTNPQWALTPWLGLAGLVVLCAMPATRRLGITLGAGLVVGLAAWVLATHLQSRFLIPLVPLMAAGFGLAVVRLAPLPRVLVAGIALAGSAAWSVGNFAGQRGGHPNALLALGPGVFTGRMSLEEVGDTFSTAGVNETAPTGGLLLVGDATPLYFRAPVVYATVWDTHPLARAMSDHPGDPAAWTAALRSSGLEWVLVSYPELGRLRASGWSDPGLTPDRVASWAATLGEPARVWPEQGRALYRLPKGPD
jgi:hypothetical protein